MRELSKEQTIKVLIEWSRWQRDNEPDPAEVYYYTICPDFADVVEKAGSLKDYDPDAAWNVEKVFRTMFRPYPDERKLLIDYYTREVNAEDFANDAGMSRRTLFRRLADARKVFADTWCFTFWET